MNQYLKKYKYTQIHFGAGARKKIEKLGPELGKTALLATSRGFAKREGFLDEIVNIFNKTGVHLQVFAGIEPEPLDSTVENLARQIKKSRPDFLIALGGGSVIDCLKVASVMATLGVDLDKLWGADRITPLLSKARLKLRPLIAIPSTSGSGSEVTKYAVLYDSREKIKKAVIDLALCPSIALVDPEIMMSMPEKLTIETGLDALAHLVESFLNNQPAPGWLDDMTKDGIHLILQYLPSAAQHPRLLEPREKVALASTCAGIAITFKGTGLPHGFSFAFRDVLSHGSTVALLLAPCWRYYLPMVELKTRLLAPMFGVSLDLPMSEVAEAIFSALGNFYRKLGHPAKLSELPQVNDALLRDAVQALLKNPSKLDNAPRPVPAANARDILMQILKSA
jgi:alcohol dehydrogenase